MTSIKKIKDILHREQLKEDEKHVGIPSWNRRFNELATSLGHADLSNKNHRKITEYTQLRKIERDEQRQQLEYMFLNRASKQLLLALFYPLAMFIFLFVILNL